MTKLITPPTLFRASAPIAQLHEQLGPLTELPGTWVGKGFNLIAVPDYSQRFFTLEPNASIETLTFTSIGGPLPDRGSHQEDIFFVGLHYFQQVSDALKSTALHVETGMWLNLPGTTNPQQDPCVTRLSTIPHGDSLLAQGAYSSQPVNGPYAIYPVDATPFTLGPQGQKIVVTDPNILNVYNTLALPDDPDIPPQSQFDPNLVLNKVLRDQENQQIHMIALTILHADTQPVGGINNTPIGNPSENVGGIVNVPFVNINAAANHFSGTFWIEKMLDKKTNLHFIQLQYTQTALLEFAGGISPDNPVAFWPHISVGTLVKQ